MKLSAILGPAGSGKTTRMRERAAATGESIKLTATTGIASVNLGPSVTTLNSVMGFFDEVSLAEAVRTGKFKSRVRTISANFNTVAVDEISMLTGKVLSVLIAGFLQVEKETDTEAPELLVIGDFLQLPPVNGPFAFESPEWKRFAGNITTLTGSYRQKDDLAFYTALQAARAGRGIDCLLALRKAGITYRTTVDAGFNGTTISAINTSVEKINRERYAQLSTPEVFYDVVRWGIDDSAWKGIPSKVSLKVGALVMILANRRDRDEDTGEMGDLLYANGDTGVVIDMNPSGVTIELTRNGVQVDVPYVTRRKLVPVAPPGLPSEWISREQAFMIGSIRYLPVRLAYASSIHKSQGLTIDKVQLDARTRFAGEPGMMYTALSRCRSAKDLVIVVADAGSFARRVNTHQKVKEWI